MNRDVLVPRGNEAELLIMAERLGFDELILLYPMTEDKPREEDIKSGIKSKKIDVRTACLITDAAQAPKAKKRFGLVFAPATRAFFENKHVDYLVNAESDDRNDFLYQKRAGLDDIMSRLAKEKGKTVVFNLGAMAGTGLNNLNILGRMGQNARLCRKYKVKTMVATFACSTLGMRAPKDMDGFARAIKLY